MFFSLLSLSIRADNNALWELFINPDNDALTKVWWFHGETETTETGIDADLEAFKDAGIGGVVFYDQVHSNAEGAFDAMSPEWWQMLKYAAKKAKSLGLSFEVAASNGYVGGGPWITPELGMQQLSVVDTIISVEKPGAYSIDLPHNDPYFRSVATLMFPEDDKLKELTFEPASCLLYDNESDTLFLNLETPTKVCAIQYRTMPRGKGSTGSMNIPGPPQERYFGALYVDMPNIGVLEYSMDGENWEEAAKLPGIESVIGYKSRERSVSFPAVCGKYFRVRLHDWIDPEGKLNKLQVENIRLSTRDIIDNWQVKSGLRTEISYPHPVGGNIGAINPETVIDVTSKTDSEGNLTLFLQPGCWHIMRFGHLPTYSRTKHGRKNLLGLEADVMSEEAATVHYNNYFKAICDTLAAEGCKPDGMCMDSHEAGIQNWTSGFEKRFSSLRGYELTPWLPALAGYIVGDRNQSEQVLKDFRLTIAETIADKYYGTLARLCHEDNVTFTSQAMLNIDNDNILSRSKADKPQGEFWAYQTDGNYDCLDAASTAHLYGHPIASAEAFTDTPYSKTWDELLQIANLAYCRGINEFAVCASSYQPWVDRKYDDDASAHPYIFHRHNPAWQSVGPFWEYQARCASMLRQGIPVVDLCIFIGEDFPAKTFAYRLPVIPEGYNFDVCTRDALLNRFYAADGALGVEGGMRYRALVVQKGSDLSPEVIEKLETLERGGVPVIWHNRGEDVAEKLTTLNIKPDLETIYAGNGDTERMANVVAGRLCFFHRHMEDAEMYFVYNHSDKAFESRIKPLSAFSRAEGWNPNDATRLQLKQDAEGQLQLHLAPYQSLFVITR